MIYGRAARLARQGAGCRGHTQEVSGSALRRQGAERVRGTGDQRMATASGGNLYRCGCYTVEAVRRELEVS